MAPMNYGAPEYSDGGGGGYMTPPGPFDDRWLGPPPTSNVTSIGPINPAQASVGGGEGDPRFQGRLRHGRGLPPGQGRRRFGQFQEQGGAFEPGWRKMLRQRQMQSMNGGGYQANPDWSSIFTTPGSPHYTPPTQMQPYRSPGFQALPQGNLQNDVVSNLPLDPYTGPTAQNPYGLPGGMVSWVPDQGMNQVAPQRQMANRGEYFDPFVGPF